MVRQCVFRAEPLLEGAKEASGQGLARMIEAHNEQICAWDDVVVENGGRSLTLSGLHSPPWASSHDTWWGFARAEVEELDAAAVVRVVFVQLGHLSPTALRFDDPTRRVTVELNDALRGRPVIDGSARLVTPRPDSRHPPLLRSFDRISRADERTLVVYWHGGPYLPLDHISTEWENDSVVIGVWLYGGPAKMSGQYQATIVGLDRPLGGREIRDRALAPGEPRNPGA
jgi:hypothetical protein